MIALAATADSGLVQVLLALLGVVQTIALAVIADRSRRVRRLDRRRPAHARTRRTDDAS